jgi:hypothetical protein
MLLSLYSPRLFVPVVFHNYDHRKWRITKYTMETQ